MKYLFTTLTIVALSLASQEVLASGLAQKSPGDPVCDQAALEGQFGGINLSASEFAALTPKEIAKKTGKKMSWGERILFKIAQKRIKKQLAKGIQPPSAEGKAGGSNKMGLISAILFLGGAGLALLALILKSAVPLVPFGAVCVILGLIFGIIGIKKDEKKALAIIGTVLNTVALGIGIWLFVALIIFLSDSN